MTDLLALLDHDGDRAILKGAGTPVEDVLAHLEGGATPADVATRSGIEAAEIVAALAFGALGDGAGPPLVRSGPSRPGLVGALELDALRPLLPRATEPARLALAAGLLQMYDFWDASHDAAQRADDLGEPHTAAYWHGIAHRREPDFGNASYWFRRVGKHAIFPALGAAAAARIRDHDGRTPAEAGRVVRGGAWDPLAFLVACRSALPGSPAEALARRLQACEMAAVLGASLAATT